MRSIVCQEVFTVFQKIYPAGFPAGLSLSKKPRRVWRRKPTNKIKSFSVGACTWQKILLRLRSVEFVCRRRTNCARSRLQKLVGKARKGFFDSLYPAGFPAGLVVILNLPPSGKWHRPEGKLFTASGRRRPVLQGWSRGSWGQCSGPHRRF